PQPAPAMRKRVMAARPVDPASPRGDSRSAAQLHRLDAAAEAELLGEPGFAAVRREADPARRQELLLVQRQRRARAGDDALDVALELLGGALVERLQLDRPDQGER